MSHKNLVCTGCSCLCDDIVIELDGDTITRIENACRKGASFIYAYNIKERRNSYLVRGEKVELTEAIAYAAQLIQQAKKPLIFGLDNSTLEAQAKAIELARALGATIDDCSSFCQGSLVENILQGAIPSCSFSQLQEADLLIYWGSNPYHSHPRHLSRFAFYPFERTKPAVLSCIEVRDTELTRRCKHVFRLVPGEDRNFITSILSVIKNDSGGGEDARAFLDLIKKSRFSVIFVGLGLTYALDGDFSLFQQLIKELRNILGTDLAVIPMACHANMRGLNHLLYKQVGHVNKISFANGISHGHQFSFLEQLHNQDPDCILIVGTDPYSSLPASLVKNLTDKISLITLDPYITPTSIHSTVVFGTAISGIEVGGKAIRMDGTEVSLNPIDKPESTSDEDIITRLLEELDRG
jgi:formylmethanofuran dehydrogenase subunit B